MRKNYELFLNIFISALRDKRIRELNTENRIQNKVIEKK
jgi:hypothetical protein